MERFYKASRDPGKFHRTTVDYMFRAVEGSAIYGASLLLTFASWVEYMEGVLKSHADTMHVTRDGDLAISLVCILM